MIDTEFIRTRDEECLRIEKELSDIFGSKEIITYNDALEFVSSCRKMSCGRSVLCRDGLWQIEEMLKLLASDSADDRIVEKFRDILELMTSTGCVLVKSCASKLNEAISHFPENWQTVISSGDDEYSEQPAISPAEAAAEILRSLEGRERRRNRRGIVRD